MLGASQARIVVVRNNIFSLKDLNSLIINGMQTRGMILVAMENPINMPERWTFFFLQQ
jgi:hypothetical protein